jgi:Zn finger protein HypA/HybF involved in hydrogenase expression
MAKPGSLLFFGLFLSFVCPTIGGAQIVLGHPGACAKCHSEAMSQPVTSMARALETVEQSSVLISHPLLSATYGKYSYRIERTGNQSLYSVTDSINTITMPIRWVFGASSAMGQTYILEKDGELYESRMSWYRLLNGLGPTLGGGSSLPANLLDAAGRLMSHDDKLRCFGCHATNVVHGKQLTLEELTPGVQCGHCHEETESHLAMPGKTGGPSGLSRLEGLSAEQASNFCGQCHRTWAEIAMQRTFSIANVRYQPYRLTGSKCYDPDDARISCLACHDPHKEVSDKPVDYDAKCEACHGGGKAAAKHCPVSKNNCVTCHMPKIELPGGHYKFSDHRIRIVRPNEPFPG